MANRLYENMLNITHHQGNANQDCNEILIPVRMAIIKKTKQTSKQKTQETKSVGKDMEKSECLYIVGGNVKCCSCYGKQYGGSSKKLKIELSYDPAIPLLGIYPKELKSISQRDTCTLMLVAALFTIAKIGKQSKCTSMDERIKKKYIHNEILSSL